jgi:hypothetical protein
MRCAQWLSLVASFTCVACCGLNEEVPRPPPDSTDADLKPAREFLLPKMKEDGSFGAYGYVLFGGSPLNDPIATRVLEAWLELPRTGVLVDYGEDPKGLMQVLVPVYSAPPGKTLEARTADIAKSYDVERASHIATVSGLEFPQTASVPTIVVLSLRPISQKRQSQSPCVIDFTGVSAATARARFVELMLRARRPHRWDEATFRTFIFDLHDAFNSATETGCWLLTSIPGISRLASLAFSAEVPTSVCESSSGKKTGDAP